MSIPKKMTVKCSKCGAELDVTVFESVNTDYAEDITEQITHTFNKYLTIASPNYSLKKKREGAYLVVCVCF